MDGYYFDASSKRCFPRRPFHKKRIMDGEGYYVPDMHIEYFDATELNSDRSYSGWIVVHNYPFLFNTINRYPKISRRLKKAVTAYSRAEI